MGRGLVWWGKIFDLFEGKVKVSFSGGGFMVLVIKFCHKAGCWCCLLKYSIYFHAVWPS
jgi:hypothetical protein